MKTIGYIRVSTDRQEIGPDVQREAIIRRFGSDIVWFEDIGLSGSLPIEERPGLSSALAELKRGDTLAVYRLDRVARDLLNQLVIEREITKSKSKLISCAGEGTETEGPEAKLFRQILGAIAEFERAMIRARTKGAMAMKRAKGEKTGGQVPFGYTSNNGKLVPNQDEQAVISKILQYRIDGVPIRSIIQRLNEARIPTKLGCRWNISQIQKIIARHGIG